jgi:hypothetical protein
MPRAPEPDWRSLSPLAQKVYAMLIADDGELENAMSLEHSNCGDLEREMRLWTFTVGIAYGIARGEQPYTPWSDLNEQVLVAAKAALLLFDDETTIFDSTHGGES